MYHRLNSIEFSHQLAYLFLWIISGYFLPHATSFNVNDNSLDSLDPREMSTTAGYQDATEFPSIDTPWDQYDTSPNEILISPIKSLPSIIHPPFPALGSHIPHPKSPQKRKDTPESPPSISDIFNSADLTKALAVLRRLQETHALEIFMKRESLLEDKEQDAKKEAEENKENETLSSPSHQFPHHPPLPPPPPSPSSPLAPHEDVSDFPMEGKTPADSLLDLVGIHQGALQHNILQVGVNPPSFTPQISHSPLTSPTTLFGKPSLFSDYNALSNVLLALNATQPPPKQPTFQNTVANAPVVHPLQLSPTSFPSPPDSPSSSSFINPTSVSPMNLLLEEIQPVADYLQIPPEILLVLLLQSSPTDPTAAQGGVVHDTRITAELTTAINDLITAISTALTDFFTALQTAIDANPLLLLLLLLPLLALLWHLHGNRGGGYGHQKGGHKGGGYGGQKHRRDWQILDWYHRKRDYDDRDRDLYYRSYEDNPIDLLGDFVADQLLAFDAYVNSVAKFYDALENIRKL